MDFLQTNRTSPSGHGIENLNFTIMKTYKQEDVNTRDGIQPRYQVWALDENGKPVKYHFSDNSPIGKYALVDRENHTEILETIETKYFEDAYKILMENVEPEEE
jgi:hypothetical protein